jgi:uncharacterized protein YdeI (YjbR/CyaY-like superfamily)
MKPTYFATPADLRGWFERHHADTAELWVGFHKKGSGTPSITWPESVDEALCVGWIDGVRRSVDERRYMIRFTPRRAGSTWSVVNVRRVAALEKAGRMKPPGLAAFRARKEAKSGLYSFEHKGVELAPAYAAALRKNGAARGFFDAQPPWYRRTSSWWVMSAKQEQTRLRRLATLIADSAAGRRIGPLRRKGDGAGRPERRAKERSAQPRAARASVAKRRSTKEAGAARPRGR